MAKTSLKEKNRADANADKSKGKVKRPTHKDQIRQIFLNRLPKGGIAVEIGVWKGEFSGTILDIIEPDKLYLIDPWANVTDDSHSEAFAGRTEDAKMERIFNRVENRYSKQIAAGQVEIIRDWSQPALAQFDDGSIDFAYVDGDHSYEGVCADLESLFPKMRVGGTMAFDDYHRRGWWGDGVIRAINEFMGRNPRSLRVRAIAGAQIAIEKIEPLEE